MEKDYEPAFMSNKPDFLIPSKAVYQSQIERKLIDESMSYADFVEFFNKKEIDLSKPADKYEYEGKLEDYLLTRFQFAAERDIGRLTATEIQSLPIKGGLTPFYFPDIIHYENISAVFIIKILAANSSTIIKSVDNLAIPMMYLYGSCPALGWKQKIPLESGKEMEIRHQDDLERFQIVAFAWNMIVTVRIRERQFAGSNDLLLTRTHMKQFYVNSYAWTNFAERVMKIPRKWMVTIEASKTCYAIVSGVMLHPDKVAGRTIENIEDYGFRVEY